VVLLDGLLSVLLVEVDYGGRAQELAELVAVEEALLELSALAE